MNETQIQLWYEQYKTGIYRYILSMTRDPALAEDVLQDTFVKLLTGGIPFREGKEQAWLYKTARNRCLDILKHQKNQPRLPQPSPEEPRWEFVELLSPLADRDRELVALKILGGFTHREIASITGTTVHAAKKRYERAIQKLREEMEVTP